MQLHELTITQAREGLANKQFSLSELTEAFVNRIEAKNAGVDAFLEFSKKRAMEMANANPTGALAGIPMAIKDNMCTKGVRTTCASRILEGFIPTYESTATTRLADAGYVLLGKANMDEFAMGSSCENSAFFPTANPWDLTRIPGGSSGGSAAAVAADFCIAALGSDTGGSIRQPASLCGVVGLKPTYGRVSRYGLVAFASSLDQIGPITKTVEDAAILMNIIGGHDPKDSTSANIPSPDYASLLGRDIKGLRVGIPKEYFIEGVDAEVDASVRAAIKHLESLGAIPVEVSLPHTDYAVATYYILATSEASSNLARFDGVKYGYRAANPKDLMDMYVRSRAEGFGSEVKRRIMIGTHALSSGYYDAYYLKAQQARTLMKQDFDRAFEHCDVIATPTSPEVAFKKGEKTSDPLKMYLSDIFTISVNLAGVPGISIPCGFSSAGLPIGLQLIAKHFDEPRLLQVAHAYERSTEWHTRRAAL